MHITAGKEYAIKNLAAEILYYDFCKGIEENILLDSCTEQHYQLIYILEGFGELCVEDALYLLHSEDFLLHSRGNILIQKHSESTPISLYSIGFKTNWNLYLSNDVQSDGILHVNRYNKYSSKIKLIMDFLSEEINLYGFSEACNGVLAALIAYLLRLQKEHFDIALERDNIILAQEVRQFLNLHYTENLSLKQIADTFHISRDYLSHLFKNSINNSPINYIINLRISEAQMLLVNTNWSINEIAKKVGYDNASYFNTLFKKIIGISPGEFRLHSKKNI